jgi:membrane protease YdiL (CAAX protease family)
MQDDAHYATPEPDIQPTQQSLAPWWHTVAILLLFGLWAIADTHRAAAVANGLNSFRYIGSIMFGWMTLGTVVAGLYHRRDFFRATLLRNARPWYIEAARGVGIYLSIVVLLGIVHTILRHSHLALPVDRSVLTEIAPHTWPEFALWFCISLTAGFCEEHVFRGYLLPQAITGCRAAHLPRIVANIIAILTISVLFGALHLYQGVGGAIMISILGIAYACYALYLGNLRALIVAHFLQDFISGLVLFIRHLHGH